MEFADKPYAKRGQHSEADMVAKKQMNTLEAAKRQMNIKGSVVQPHEIETFQERVEEVIENDPQVDSRQFSPVLQQALKRTQPVADKKHPIIAQMMKSFGMKETKKYNLTLNKGEISFRYVMTIVPDDAATWAFKEANTKAIIEGDQVGIAWFQCLMVSLSVVGLEDVPVWEAFNISPINDEIEDLQFDPYNISFRIRKESCKHLSKMIWSQMGPIGDKLWEFYEGMISKENRIESSYDREKIETSKERYVCPMDDCNITEYLDPVFDENGNEKFFYCKIHKVELVKTLVNDDPLV